MFIQVRALIARKNVLMLMYIVIVVAELRDCNCVYRLARPWLILWTVGLHDLVGCVGGGESCIALASLSWITRLSQTSFYRTLGPA